MSMKLDIAIILATIAEVVRRRNVHVDPGAMMLDLDAERPAGRCIEPYDPRCRTLRTPLRS